MDAEDTEHVKIHDEVETKFKSCLGQLNLNEYIIVDEHMFGSKDKRNEFAKQHIIDMIKLYKHQA